MTKAALAPALRKQIRHLLAAGGQISCEGAAVVVDGPPEVADSLRAKADQLAISIVPSVTPDDAALVRSLLVGWSESALPTSQTPPLPETPLLTSARASPK